MSETPIGISITGKLSYSDEITISQAAQIIAFLNSAHAGGAQLGEPLLESSTANKTSNKKVDNPHDALEVSGAQTNPEKIVALGAYVLQDGGDTFKAEDIKAQFRRARETAPGNFPRDLSSAISAGWIAEDEDAPGEYYLNSKMDGILDGDFVFPKGSITNGRSRGTNKSTPRAKNAKTAKPESLNDVDEFHSTMPGYLGYSKMKSEKDRIIWIAVYMRDKHERKGVTNKEIAWISDHIGTGIPSDNISGSFNSAKAANLLVRSTLDQSIKVTEEGIEHLAALSSGKEA
jgi:hypothetical protein